MAPPTMPRGHGLATLGPVGGGVGRDAALYNGISARDQSDELTSRVWPAIQADYLRAYHRPRKKVAAGEWEDSSSWALVRSVGRKISGLWPFWSEGVSGEDDESVIARRRLGKSSRRLRPPPRPPMRHSRDEW